MTLHDISVEKKKIGLSLPPFIIAEMSGNHNQSLNKALELVDEAAKAGADAVKLQTYTADTMTLNLDKWPFKIEDRNSLWFGKSLYELYEMAFTPWDWHKPIFERCKQKGLIGFSTPFDLTAVDFLESLNVPCYKIASFENIDLTLIRKVAATKKPVIISTGMAKISEIEDAVMAARGAGCKDLILLKCTSSYPANVNSSNLKTIPHLSSTFGCHAGLSDHTLGVGAAIAAVGLGAKVIEKHITMDKTDGGPDSAFSLEPHELALLVKGVRDASDALGEIYYGPSAQEKASLQFRRTLYIVEDMQAGDILSQSNLRAIRPGFGLSPKFLDLVLGKKIRCAASKGTPLNWDLVLD